MTELPIAERRLVVQIPEMNRVSIERNVPFARDVSDTLEFDVYRPAASAQSPLPAVIFVTGYSEAGSPHGAGRLLKDWAAYRDWACLMASAGVIAITYSNEDPVRDAAALLEHITNHAESLGIDGTRLGIWSCSGNTATALAVLHAHREVACAALCYGYLMDMPGHDEVACAAAQFGFVNAAHTMRIGDLADVPMLLVRAGHDEMPGLNASLDRFVARALANNLPIDVLNFPRGVHAFDVGQKTEAAQRVVHRIRQFLVLCLKT